MSRQCKRICDNCLSEVVEMWGWWRVERVRRHPSPEVSHAYLTEPRIEWDFCSQECMIEKVREWTEEQAKLARLRASGD